MSGQCLSPSERGHALTPRTHQRLGEPLPRQLANRTQSPPQAESHLWSKDVIWYYLRFPGAIPVLRVGNYVLLSLSPLSFPLRGILARLACLIHAANVHSEPGSNPSINCSLIRQDSSRRMDSKSIEKPNWLTNFFGLDLRLASEAETRSQSSSKLAENQN